MKTLSGWIAIAVIIGWGGFLCLPFLCHGFWPFSGDAQVHLNWYSNFSKQLWEGDLYPRWLCGMNDGLGSPVCFYYPPMAYFITSLFHPFFGNDPESFKQLGFSVCLGLVGSGFSAYAWMRKTSNEPRIALMAALFFMAMPYHLGTDIYVRGALAEFWSFVWTPLILLAVCAIAEDNRWGIAGLATSYALLIMTHLPTTLIFSVVPLCYAGIKAKPGRHWSALGRTAVGMGLGMGLASIYLVPAMTMQGAVSMEQLTHEGLHYTKSFFFSAAQQVEIARKFNFEVFQVVLATVAAAACGYVLAVRNGGTVKKEARFWSVVVAVCLFMMFPISKPVWLLFPPLQMIQFPWRFGTVVCVGTAALVGLGLKSFRERFSLKLCLLFQVLWVLVVIGLYLSWTAIWPQHILAKNGELPHVTTTEEADEYRPQWVKSSLQEAIKQFGLAAANSRAEFQDSTGEVTMVSWKPRDVVFEVSSPSAAALLVHQFYFPGWKADLDGRAILVTPSQPHGLIQLLIPGGKHRLRLQLRAEREEVAGRIISGISAVGVLILAGCFLGGRRRSPSTR
jgi:uncharacterized membrane protein